MGKLKDSLVFNHADVFYLGSYALLSCSSVFVASWSPAGKGLTSWLSLVMSNCEFVTFPLASWVRCGT